MCISLRATMVGMMPLVRSTVTNSNAHTDVTEVMANACHSLKPLSIMNEEGVDEESIGDRV